MESARASPIFWGLYPVAGKMERARACPAVLMTCKRSVLLVGVSMGLGWGFIGEGLGLKVETAGDRLTFVVGIINHPRLLEGNGVMRGAIPRNKDRPMVPFMGESD